MSDLTKRFQEIMKDIENNVSDKDVLDYVNKKISEISMLHMEVIDDMASIIKDKIESMEKVQKAMESKISKIEATVTGIENDIYDDGFDFEIVCPYCNTEFTADVESKSDIRCPECQNIIELDWNADEFSGACSGHCSSCGSKCGSSFFDEYEENDEEDEDNDDDM